MQDYAKNGDNTKLKSFAADTLPTIKDHLAASQKIDAELQNGAM